MWYCRIILTFTFLWQLLVKVIFKTVIKKNSNIDIYLCIWVAVDKFPNDKVSNKRPEIIFSGAQDVTITGIAVYEKIK